MTPDTLQENHAENLLCLMSFFPEGKEALDVEPKFFSAAVHRDVATQLHRHWTEFGSPPGPAHLPDLLTDRLEQKDTQQAAMYSRLLVGLQELSRTLDPAVVLSQRAAFMRRQRLMQGVTRAYKEVEAGRLGEAEFLLNEILRLNRDAGPQAQADDLDDLLRRDLPEVRWIVEALLPEGLTLLVSRPKNKKTLSAMHIAEAVRRGETVFGFFRVQTPGAVLFLALEDNARRIRKRSQSIVGAFDYRKPAAHPATYVYSWKQGDVAGLCRHLDEHPATRLIVIDTLGRFRLPQSRNGNAYAEDYHSMTALQRLASDRGIAVLVLHHSRKSAAEDVTDEISGTTGIAAAADAIWILKRERGGKEATLFITGRDIEEEMTLALRWEQDRTAWAVEGEASEVQLSNERREVLELLGTAGTSIKDLAAATGKKYHTVRHLAEKLVEDGHAIKQPDGTYIRVGKV